MRHSRARRVCFVVAIIFSAYLLAVVFLYFRNDATKPWQVAEVNLGPVKRNDDADAVQPQPQPQGKQIRSLSAREQIPAPELPARSPQTQDLSNSSAVRNVSSNASTTIQRNDKPAIEQPQQQEQQQKQQQKEKEERQVQQKHGIDLMDVSQLHSFVTQTNQKQQIYNEAKFPVNTQTRSQQIVIVVQVRCLWVYFDQS